MANNMSLSASVGVLLSSMIAAVQWRLLLLWLLIMLIPVAVVALPLWQVLGGMLDTSVHAAEWAQRVSATMFADVIFSLADHAEWLSATAIMGLILTLLLSPFLDGMIIGSGRAGRVLGFGALLQSGVLEYGRMFRLMLWSVLPYALVIKVAAIGLHMVDNFAAKAILESRVDEASNVLHVIVLIVFVLIHSIVESARAAFIADMTLRSAMRALWRGTRQFFRWPWKTLLFYAVVTLVGLVLASIFGIGRIHVTAFGTFGFVFAFLLSQLVVLAIGWMRTARLFALAEVARSVVPMQRPQAEYR